MSNHFNLFLALFVLLQAYMAARQIGSIVRWLFRTDGAMGTVVSKTVGDHWSNPWGATSLDVKFLADPGGERLLKLTILDPVGFWGQWPIGSTVQVQFNPRNPENCEVSISHQPKSWLVLLVIGGIFNLLFLCGSIILITRHLRDI